MALQPPTPRFPTLAESVADWVGEEVLSGRWAPGRRITEAEVAERVGVSRQPVREGLRLLSDQGLIRIVPRVGAIVADYNPDMIEQIYQLRAELESWMIRLAIPRITGPEAEQLRGAVDEWIEESHRFSDLTAHYDRAWAIRVGLMRRAGNDVAVDMAADLRTRLRGFPKVLRRDLGHLQLVSGVLDTLAGAAVAGDADRGALVISDYLLGNTKLVKKAFGEPSDPAPASRRA